MKKWEQITTKIIHQDQWIRLRADECRHPSGRIISPYYVIEENDWVHIVAIDKNGEILVTKQYRYAADSVCLEIPCGVIEPGELPIHTAKRELMEETGYEASSWELLMKPFANPARQTNRIYCYIAKGLTDTGNTHTDENEDIEFEFMPWMNLRKAIQDGRFSQALHIASLFAALDNSSE